VTVYGRNLDSVAEPRITVTVVVTNLVTTVRGMRGDTNTTDSDGNTSSTVSDSGVLSLYYTAVGVGRKGDRGSQLTRHTQHPKLSENLKSFKQA